MKNSTVHQNKDPFYYRYRSQIVGIFVLIPLLAVPLLLANLFLRSDYFTMRFPLYLKVSNSIPIEPGNSVTIMEKRVGYVKAISLNTDGHLDIEMSIEEQYRKFIRTDSRCTIKQKQALVGDWLIDISASRSPGMKITEGDTLHDFDFIRVEDMIQRLTDMSKSANMILDQMAYGKGVISMLISDEELSRDIKELTARTNRFFGDLNSTMDSLPAVLDNFNRAVHSLDRLGTEGVKMTHNLDSFATHARDLVDSLQIISNKIDTLARETGEVPPVMIESFREIDRSVEDFKLILDGLKTHWFLKRSIEKAQERDE
ncbi:MAG: MlaD family protein [Fibrobacterota bacterium]